MERASIEAVHAEAVTTTGLHATPTTRRRGTCGDKWHPVPAVQVELMHMSPHDNVHTHLLESLSELFGARKRLAALSTRDGDEVVMNHQDANVAGRRLTKRTARKVDLMVVDPTVHDRSPRRRRSEGHDGGTGDGRNGIERLPGEPTPVAEGRSHPLPDPI
jgi:hypothetical protein